MCLNKCMCLCVLCFSVISMSSEAFAQEQVKQDRQRLVSMPRFHVLGAGAETVSGGQDATSAYFHHHVALFDLVSERAQRSAITSQSGYQDQLDLARGMRDLGLEHYRELKLAEAVEYLNRAKNAYLRVGYDFVDPREVSETLLYLALSLLEQDDSKAAVALGVVREMILMDPSRELKAGYFPENVVSTYDVALKGLTQELERRGLPLEMDSVARRLAEFSSVDRVILGFTVPSSSGRGYVARLFVWSRRSEKVEWSDEHFVEDVQDELLSSVFSRMAARWADCVKQPEVRVDVQGGGGVQARQEGEPGEIGFELGLSYGTYLVFPRLRSTLGPAPPGQIAHFGNYGLSFLGQYRVKRELSLYSKVQFWVSQREHSGLIDARDVTALRSFLGAELVARLGRFKPGVRLGVEVSHLSDFEILGEIGCVPRNRSGECAPEFSSQEYTGHNILLGVNLSPVLSWRLNSSLDITGSTGVSYYLYSGTESEEVNVPWSNELGVRYRF